MVDKRRILARFRLKFTFPPAILGTSAEGKIGRGLLIPWPPFVSGVGLLGLLPVLPWGRGECKDILGHRSTSFRASLGD